jgi:hypothetical protein
MTSLISNGGTLVAAKPTARLGFGLFDDKETHKIDADTQRIDKIMGLISARNKRSFLRGSVRKIDRSWSHTHP